MTPILPSGLDPEMVADAKELGYCCDPATGEVDIPLLAGAVAKADVMFEAWRRASAQLIRLRPKR